MGISKEPRYRVCSSDGILSGIVAFGLKYLFLVDLPISIQASMIVFDVCG